MTGPYNAPIRDALGRWRSGFLTWNWEGELWCFNCGYTADLNLSPPEFRRRKKYERD